MAINGIGSYEVWSGSGGNLGAASLQSWTATGAASFVGADSAYEEWTASATMVVSFPYAGAAELQPWSGAVTLAENARLLQVSGEFKQLTASATMPFRVDLSTKKWTASARLRSNMVASGSYRPWAVSGLSGFAYFERWE